MAETQKRTKKGRRISAIIISMVVAFAMLVTGCGESEDTQHSATQATQTDNIATRVFTDDCDRQVEVPEKVTTVIASGSLAQITIFAIAPETLIAINGAWSDDAAEYVDQKYLELPEVGSFFGNHDLNYEEIAKLSPQIVLDVGEDKPDMESNLEDITTKTGIPAIHIDAYYDSMDSAFEKMGVLFGKEEEAKALADFCRDTLAESKETLEKVDKKKTVMYCTQEDGLNVLAKDSYHSQIVDYLSDNVAVLEDPSSQGSGNEVNLEQMMIWNPEIIIFAPSSYYDYVADDPAWQSLKAIKKGKYYEVPSGPYNWMGSPPSSNRILGMLWMAKLLYPNEAEFDLKEKTTEYYKLFYHHDLSDDEYNNLLKNSVLKE